MGYGCYHASIVQLERLHDSRSDHRFEAMTNLRICFKLLGAMRKYYLPVEGWVRSERISIFTIG